MKKAKKQKIKSIEELTKGMNEEVKPFIKEFDENLKKVLLNKQQKEEDAQKSEDSSDC